MSLFLTTLVSKVMHLYTDLSMAERKSLRAAALNYCRPCSKGTSIIGGKIPGFNLLNAGRAIRLKVSVVRDSGVVMFAVQESWIFTTQTGHSAYHIHWSYPSWVDPISQP